MTDSPETTHTGVCKKCIKEDMMDGWGRCTNCVEPSATEAEAAAAVKEFLEGRRHA